MGTATRKRACWRSLVNGADKVQGHPWEKPDADKQARLMAAVDQINARHGKHTVRCGSCGGAGVSGPTRAWHLRATHRSPLYTTS